MKLITTTQEVRQSEPGHARKFAMAATGKAFEILSSGLYKDSVRAIIRELGTNAADSHVAANKRKVPFAAHLPTMLEPFFYVKDFGTGMSDFQIRGGFQCICGHTESADLEEAPTCTKCDHGVMEFKAGLYTTYFASDKSHSDDYTGCLGLGSKSPFAYTDTFTVTSVHKGIKGVYTAYREDGMPGISKLSLEPTTEPDGMEVSLPVKSKDFADFRTKAIATYKWFNPRPIVAGISAGDYGVIPVVLENGNWTITTDDNFSAMMGNICYDIDFDTLDESFKKSLTEYEKWVAEKVGPILKLSIGEVDMAASRETLKYTPKTHDALKRRLNQVVQECLVEAERQLAVCKTLWEARIMLNQISENRWLKGLLKIGVHWHGKLIHTSIGLTRDGVRRVGCRRYYMVKGRRGSMRMEFEEADNIAARQSSVFFVNDMPTNFTGRIERHLRAYGGSLYIFHDLPGQSQTLEQFAEEEEITHLIRKLSLLEEMAPKAKKPVKKTAKILRFDDYGAYGASKSVTRAWKETQIEDINDGEYVYVEVNGFEWSAGDLSQITSYGQPQGPGFAPPSQLGTKLKEMLEFLPFGIVDVVGLRKSAVPQMAKLPNWTRLDVWLKKFCEDQAAMRLTAAKMVLWRKLRSTVPDIILDLKGTKGLRPKNPVRQLHKIYKDLSKGRDHQVNACLNACRHADVKLPDLSDTEKRATDLLKTTLRRYPMLFMLERQCHLNKAHEQRKVIQYLRLIDINRVPIQKAAPDKAPI